MFSVSPVEEFELIHLGLSQVFHNTIIKVQTVLLSHFKVQLCKFLFLSLCVCVFVFEELGSSLEIGMRPPFLHWLLTRDRSQFLLHGPLQRIGRNLAVCFIEAERERIHVKERNFRKQWQNSKLLPKIFKNGKRTLEIESWIVVTRD